MAGYGSEEDNDVLQEPEAGPSSSSPKKRPVALSDMDSASEFAPEKEELKLLEDQDKEEDVIVEPVADGDEASDSDGEPLAPPSKQPAGFTTTAPKKGKATVSIINKPSISGPSLSRSSKRQQYTLPTPSVHHRHRAVPLYSRSGRVERLASHPSLFRPYDVVMTNNFTHNAKVTDRVNKSWGYNVGWGPLWDLVEDRGWYKEAIEGVPDIDTEANRRPKVYKEVQVKDGWEILNEMYA